MQLKLATKHRDELAGKIARAYRECLKRPLWDLTVDAITKRARISRPTFYTLYSDLFALVAEQYRLAVERAVLLLVDLPPLHESHDPERRARVRLWIRTLLEVTARQRDVIAPAVTLAALSPLLTESIREQRAHYLKTWQDKLPEGQKHLAPILSASARAIIIDVGATPENRKLLEEMWMRILFGGCPLCQRSSSTKATSPPSRR